MDDQWLCKYEAHIRSARWKNMRRDMMRLRGPRCEVEGCGRGPPLELHHKTYARLGRELTTDLKLLCSWHHGEADRERERQVEWVAQTRRYNAGLSTFATKKYGEDWEMRVDEDRAAEEFDEWLENKGD